MAKKAASEVQQKAVVTMPDMGLSKAQVTNLKKKFKNEFVNSLGGPEKLAARRVVVIIQIEIVFAAPQ